MRPLAQCNDSRISAINICMLTMITDANSAAMHISRAVDIFLSISGRSPLLLLFEIKINVLKEHRQFIIIMSVLGQGERWRAGQAMGRAHMHNTS